MMAAFLRFVREQNFNRASKEIALDLIYVLNGYRIYKDHIWLGCARELDQRPEILDDANTYVPCRIDPMFDDRFDGRNGFMYRRIELTEINGIENLKIVPPFTPFRTRDVLDQINDRLQVQFNERDLADVEYTTGQMELVAHPNSWVWIGKSTFEAEDPDGLPLFEVTSDLSGFKVWDGTAPPS